MLQKGEVVSKLSNLDDFVSLGMEDLITDFTVDKKCSSCGNCCSNFLPISKKEITRIKQYIKKHGIKPSVHILPVANNILDFTCPFRDNQKKICTIYAVRPVICQKFICNNDKRAKLTRDDLTSINGVVDMANTFFNKPSTIDGLLNELKGN